MSVTRYINYQTSQVTIAIHGRFDFSQHQAFRESYRDIDPKVMRFTVDLVGATYMDSSALGMLLLLRDYTGSDSNRVVITGCSEDVLRVLKIANFDKLFPFE